MCDGTIRFKGKESCIWCFAYVLNLVVKDMLAFLGSSIHKDATAFLNRVAKAKWKKITVPGAAGVITILQILVLWIVKSPQQIQEWDNCENTSKAINYDVDTHWNSTECMIADAEDCHPTLDDTV